jgi:predicted O-methyltransferase YrrM
VFIDANKKSYNEYGEWAEKNLRPGGLMIADNVFLGGSVYGLETKTYSEGQVAAMKAFQHHDPSQKKWKDITLPTHEGLQVSLKL